MTSKRRIMSLGSATTIETTLYNRPIPSPYLQACLCAASGRTRVGRASPFQAYAYLLERILSPLSAIAHYNLGFTRIIRQVLEGRKIMVELLRVVPSCGGGSEPTAEHVCSLANQSAMLVLPTLDGESPHY